MHVTLVHVHVVHDRLDDFMVATLRNREGTIREPGNVRFDVLRAADDPARFLLLEVFRSGEDAAAHKRTPHYLEWRDRVADWMASPRQGVRYEVISPEDPSAW